MITFNDAKPIFVCKIPTFGVTGYKMDLPEWIARKGFLKGCSTNVIAIVGEKKNSVHCVLGTPFVYAVVWCPRDLIKITEDKNNVVLFDIYANVKKIMEKWREENA